MKAHTGFIELVLILSMMVACVPLLMTLVITCNRTKMNYLSDKTVYKISDSIEWVEQNVNGKKTLVPSTLAPIGIDYGGAQIIALINDDYCPEDGKFIYYSYDTDSVFTAHSEQTTPSLSIVDGWKAQYNTYWSQQMGETVNDSTVLSSLNNTYKNSKCYLVWSAVDKKWVITSKFVNVYETR